MRNIAVCLIASVIALSCTSQKPTGAGKGSIVQGGTTTCPPGLSALAPGARAATLEIVPKVAVRGSVLSLIPLGFSLEGAKIEWLVNDVIVNNATETQFRADEVRKGDMITARAFGGSNEIKSVPVAIMNSAPVITKAELISDEHEGRASLRAEVSGQDIDGDQVMFTYAWTKNTLPAGAGNRIEGTLKRGDFVTVTVVPFDGTDYGAATSVRREIANQRPVITAHKEFSFKDNVYRYQIKAEDPDGDMLTYALENPEIGMSIDPSMGLITWQVPAEFKGNKNITFSVTDGNGGSAQFNVEVDVNQ